MNVGLQGFLKTHSQITDAFREPSRAREEGPRVDVGFQANQSMG